MPITFDNAVSWNLAGGPNTLAYIVTGTDVYVFVAVASQNRTGQTIGTIKYNAVDLALVLARNDGLLGRVELWGLVAPATGSHNMVITWAAQADIASGVIASYAGVHQTTPLGTAVGSSGLGTNMTSAVTLDANDWEILAGQSSGVTFTVHDGNNRAQNAFKPRLGIADGITNAVGYTLSASADWSAVGVPLKPAAGAGVTQAQLDGASMRGIDRGVQRGMARRLVTTNWKRHGSGLFVPAFTGLIAQPAR